MRHISEKEKCLKIFWKKLLTNEDISCIVLFVAEVSDNIRNARVAQWVERDLAKVEAAGSSPVSRSFYFSQRERVIRWIALFLCERRAQEGSSNVRGLGGPKVLLGRR